MYNCTQLTSFENRIISVG